MFGYGVLEFSFFGQSPQLQKVRLSLVYVLVSFLVDWESKLDTIVAATAEHRLIFMLRYIYYIDWLRLGRWMEMTEEWTCNYLVGGGGVHLLTQKEEKVVST